MSRTGGNSNAFPKSKGKLDEADVEMDNLDEDQDNVGDQDEDLSNDEGFQELQDEDQEDPDPPARNNLENQNRPNPLVRQPEPKSQPGQLRGPVSGATKPVTGLNDSRIDDNHNFSKEPKRQNLANAPPENNGNASTNLQGSKSPNPQYSSGILDRQQVTVKPSPSVPAFKPTTGEAGSLKPPQNEGQLEESKSVQKISYESDPQFQQYLSTLTEYDRSRYNQLLKKNLLLRDELKNISEQTEALLKKER